MARMADEHTGGMIALIPRAEDAAQLVVPGGEKADDLHLTLAYLGDDVSTMSSETRNTILAFAAASAATMPTIEARVFGHAVFNPDGHADRDPCSVYLIGDSAMIEMARHSIMEDLPGELRAIQHAPFIAHVTAKYALKKLSYIGDIAFDRLVVAFAGDQYVFTLGEPLGEKAANGQFVEYKRQVSTSMRDSLAKQGKANPDGGYPIETVGDLKNAIQAFGRAKDKPKTKKLIIRRARALNAVNLLPDGWLEGKKTLVELADDIEHKVMSLDPRAAKLREYWAHGKGRTKWHDWDSLHRQLRKYVKNPRILDGLTANIYKLATGRWPGANRKDEKVMAIISAEEWKAAMLLTDPDAPLTDDVEVSGDAGDADTAESDDEDELYEQALVDEIEWDIDDLGEPEREDEEDEDSMPPAKGPRVSMTSLFD